MTRLQTHLLAIVSALALTILLATLFLGHNVKASAPPGLPATIATSSAIAVTNSSLQVFATSSCAARIITTYASPVMITFTDNQGFTPSGTQGHLQAASTSVAYDSGQYGCGTVRIFSFTAQTIFVSESR